VELRKDFYPEAYKEEDGMGTTQKPSLPGNAPVKISWIYAPKTEEFY